MITESNQYKIAIYLRLSKDDDNIDESLSISNQRNIIRDFIKNNFKENTIVYEFVDDGYSGMNNIRPALSNMLQMIANKEVNCIIVKDSSRLARKNSLISYYVDELFYEENIRFISLLENFDNIKDNDTEKLILPGFFNEYHVKSTSKKVRATKENQARQGLFCGGFAPYGYIKDPRDKHKLLIDEKAALVVKKIFQEFINGQGLKNICYELTSRGIKIPSEYKNMNRGVKSANYGKWTTKTISDILHNPTYAGHLTQHKEKVKNISSKKKVKRKPQEWIIAYNSCPAIIDQETFEIVQMIWEKNKRRQKNSHKKLLTGFIYCEDCGHTVGITLSKWKTKDGLEHKKYLCHCNYYKSMSKYKRCTPHKINYEDLEKRVLENIKNICTQNFIFENMKDVIKANDKSRDVIIDLEQKIKYEKTKLKNIEGKLKNLYEDKLSNFITKKEYIEFKEKFLKESELINKDIENFELKLKCLASKIKKDDYKYDDAIKRFMMFNDLNRDILAMLIERIEIDDNLNIKIFYKFNFQS